MLKQEFGRSDAVHMYFLVVFLPKSVFSGLSFLYTLVEIVDPDVSHLFITCYIFSE